MQKTGLTFLCSESVHLVLHHDVADGDDREEIDEEWQESVESIDQHMNGDPA